MKRIIGLVCVLTLLLSVPAASFNQADVDKLVAGETELAGADFSNLDLPRPKAPETRYKGMNLEGATFQNGDLNGRVFWTSNLKSTNFSGASLKNFHNQQCDFSGANFSGANFPAVIIKGSEMRGCNFSNITTQLTDGNVSTQFRGNNMSGSSFRNANLTKATFVKCDLRGVDWKGASFSSASVMQWCTLDASAQQYFAGSGLTLKENTWVGSGISPGAAKAATTKPGVKKYEPATPKGVKKGIVIKQ